MHIWNNGLQLSLVCAVLLSGVTGCGAEAQGEGDGSEATGTTEQALTSGTPVHLASISTQFCLDSNSSGHAYAGTCNTGNYQRWTPTFLTYGWQLKDVQTGLCLDSNSAGSVYTGNCNSGSYQQWTTVTQNSPGCMPGFQCIQTLTDVATGMLLDGNTSGSVYTHVANGGNFQNWLEY